MVNTMEARHSMGRRPATTTAGARPLARALRILFDEHARALDAATEAVEPRRRLTALRALYLHANHEAGSSPAATSAATVQGPSRALSDSRALL
jgi:hypothetical protein